MANDYESEPTLMAWWPMTSIPWTDSVGGIVYADSGTPGLQDVDADVDTGVVGQAMRWPIQAADVDGGFPGVIRYQYDASPAISPVVEGDLSVGFYYKWSWPVVHTFTETGWSLLERTGIWSIRMEAKDNRPGAIVQARRTGKGLVNMNDNADNLLADTWYHIGMTLIDNDNGTRTMKLIIHNQSTGAVHFSDTDTFNDTLSTVSQLPQMTGGVTTLGSETGYTAWYDDLVFFSREITDGEFADMALGNFTIAAPPVDPPPASGVDDLQTFPSTRPDAYDEDAQWQPGTWVWGTDYVATGGGRWQRQLVAMGKGQIYYETL
jgi:hypothetical protein